MERNYVTATLCVTGADSIYYHHHHHQFNTHEFSMNDKTGPDKTQNDTKRRSGDIIQKWYVKSKLISTKSTAYVSCDCAVLFRYGNAQEGVVKIAAGRFLWVLRAACRCSHFDAYAPASSVFDVRAFSVVKRVRHWCGSRYRTVFEGHTFL